MSAPQVVPCGSYDIVLGSALLQSRFVAEDLLQRMPGTATFVILTDANVGPLYAERCARSWPICLRPRATPRAACCYTPCPQARRPSAAR